ncbi:MAG: DUF4397 domain-containing protein, partial [Anaerolineae bacterium]
MKRWTLVLTIAFLGLLLLGVTAAAQEEGDSVESPLAQPQIRVAHLAPFAMDPGTAVTVTVNGEPRLPGVEFGDSSSYETIKNGTYLIEVYPQGSSTPAVTSTVVLTVNVDYTVLAVGGANGWPLELVLLEDDNSPPAAGNAKVQIGHLAPFAELEADTLADVRLQDGTEVLTNVVFSAVEPYIELPAGEYDLKITTPGGATTLIDPKPVTLNAGDIVSLYAVGDGGNQDLGVFAWPSDQVGFLLDLSTAYLQVAHLAPFAADPGTAVTVTLDATPVLTDFVYGDSTEYLTVTPPGEYLVEVFPGGSSTAAISGTVDLMGETEYTAIAIGDGVNQALELLALEDDNTAPAAGSAKLRLGHLAPFAGGDALADVRLQDGTVLLDDVPYGAIADYEELDAGTYDLKITTPDGTVTLIDPMPVTLNDGDIVSLFAVGDGGNQALGVFAWPSDQVGFLLDLAASLRIAHLAPFDMDPGTAVTITVDGVELLAGVEFADSTTYLPLSAGVDHLIEIFPPGSTTAAISATVNLTQAM